MTDGETREVLLELGGVRLRAFDGGGNRSGRKPVLVLHGFTGSAESMECVAEPLVRDRRVVRLELPGHGGSDAPDALAPYTMSACAELIAGAARALELERPHLLGYSMGGRAALAAALAHPRAFASLVLIGATAGIADPDLRRERIASDEALADRIERDAIEAFVDHWMALPLFASQARLGERALARARAERLRNRPKGLANSLRGMGAGAQAPLHDRLDRFPGPVLFVVGEEDEKFRGIASALQAEMQDARTVILAAAGHAAHLEAPEAFAKSVNRFLEQSESDARPQSGESEPTDLAAPAGEGDRA